MKYFFRFMSMTLLVLILTSLFPASAASDAVSVVRYANPAIPADVGETIDLSNISVEFTSGNTAVSSGISWTSGDITINADKVTPATAGVYKLVASAAGKTKTVYLVVKNPTDKEYVLYYNDFSSTNISDLRIVQQTSGATVKTSDGKLNLDASVSASGYIRVLFPAWLADFGDYALETSTTITAAVDSTKWLSMMFRIQKSDYPYWQMAIRQDITASNGIELAERNADNGWNVTNKGSFTGAANENKYYTLRAEVSGNRAATYINGKRMLYSDTVTYEKGDTGLQVRGANAYFDYIKISLQTDEIKPNESSFNAVRDPASNIILPPSMITYVDSAEKLAGILNSSPAAAIFYTDKNLNVTTSEGNVFSTVKDAITALNGKVIPSFYVTDKDAVAPLCDYLKNGDIKDVFVISPDPDIVAAARDAWSYVRGVVDFTDYDSTNLLWLRELANKAGAKIIILSAEAAIYTKVENLQKMLMTVWIDNTDAGSKTELVRSITSGANGIIAPDCELLEKCYTEYFMSGSMIRAVSVIGHRGVPSLEQENSLAGCIRAYELGATMVENDIYMTTDGVIYVMHDSTVDRTTNGSGSSVALSSADIAKLQIDINKTVKTEPVPTLEDYFKEFKGKDIRIFIEVKTTDTNIIQKLAELINKYDIADQVDVITFSELQMQELRKLIPEMSVGYLTSSITLNESDVLTSLEAVTEKTQIYGTTFHPSYKSGLLGYRFLVAASYRGLTVWPWTIDDIAVFDKYFMYGTYGITTNNTQNVTDYVKNIRVPDCNMDFIYGSFMSIRYPVTKTTYGRVDSEATDAEMVVIESSDGLTLTYSDGTLSATGIGRSSVIFRIEAQTTSGQTYYVYTQPVSVTVRDLSIGTNSTAGGIDTVPVTGNNTTASGNSTGTDESDFGGTLILLVISLIAAAAAVAATSVVISKKKKK